MGMFSNEEFRQLAPQVPDIGKYWTDICSRKDTDIGKYLWQDRYLWQEKYRDIGKYLWQENIDIYGCSSDHKS